MIYIIDNNEAYEDGRVHFVDSPLSLEDMRAIAKQKDYTVDGMAEHVEWFNVEPEPLIAFYPPVRSVYVTAGNGARAQVGSLTAAQYKRLIEHVTATFAWKDTWSGWVAMPAEWPSIARITAEAACAELERKEAIKKERGACKNK